MASIREKDWGIKSYSKFTGSGTEGDPYVRVVNLSNADGESISVQNPLPTDGDSVYSKDIWVDESTFTDWSGDITDLFDDLHSQVINSTSNNPKTIVIHFNRTIISNAVGLGNTGTGNFSNVKIEIRNSGGVDTTVIDESSSNTKYTTRTFQLPITAGFNALKITFNTSDTISLSNCVILKAESVVARLQAAKPDNTITDINATAGGNLKISLEELESGVSSNSNSQLNVTLFDQGGTEARVDDMTHTLQTIDHTHHEIHEGQHFYMQGYIELNDTDTFYIKMVTPDTTIWSHFVFDIKSSGICASTLDEGATGGMTGGASKTPINNNRNSSTASGMTLTAGVTVAVSYDLRIEDDKWGASGFKESIGGGTAREDEILLKQNTTYLRTFTSGADNNIIQFKASWYEED